MDPTTVEHDALRLPPEERTKLAQKLLLSLDTLSEEELEQAWLVEADRRARELDRGEIQPIPAEEVRRKARVLLR
jgi:putative addiction module component (TIGR02574 family)